MSSLTIKSPGDASQLPALPQATSGGSRSALLLRRDQRARVTASTQSHIASAAGLRILQSKASKRLVAALFH